VHFSIRQDCSGFACSQKAPTAFFHKHKNAANLLLRNVESSLACQPK